MNLTGREDHPGVPFFVCCLCSPDPKLDSASSVVFNLGCPTHGRTWHRKMIRLADGTTMLAHEVGHHGAQATGAGTEQSHGQTGDVLGGGGTNIRRHALRSSAGGKGGDALEG
jgi:hypothetical protein